MNQVKTAGLLTAMTLLLLGIGYWLGREQGMVLAFLFAVVLNFGSYWFSDRMVLAMYNAQPVTADQAPQLYGIVADLCRRANLPMPMLYIIPDTTPNAFATGRDPEHAAVAVNQGLLQLLDANEVAGVIAHELSHVRNRDTLISAIAATIAGAIMMLARMAQFAALFGGYDDRRREGGNPIALLATIILAPLAAMVLHLWISRTREYQADRTGAEISGQPLALASALRKLEAANQARPMVDARPSTAHLFIVNPLSRQWLAGLFSTHPPLQERIARLEALAQEMGQAAHSSWQHRTA